MTRTCADVLGITGPNALWKYQYGISGTTGIKELSQANLSAGLNVPGYFQPTADGLWVDVRVPVDAGTTDNSGYPRGELRQMTAAGKEAAWDSKKTDCWFEYELVPAHLPDGKPQMCIFQLHSDKDDLLEVIWQRNTAGGFELTQRVDGTAKGQPVIQHEAGRAMVLGFGIVKGVPTVYRDGVAILTTTKMPQSTKTYAKALLYLQSNLTTDAAGQYGEILARNVRSGLGAYPGPVSQPPVDPPPVVTPPTQEPPVVTPAPTSKNLTIQIMRHGEKPSGSKKGYTDITFSHEDSHSLTANGWVRARDLPTDVYGLPNGTARAGLGRPDALYVADGPEAGERMKETGSYLAPALGLAEITRFDKGQEKALAKELLTRVGKVSAVIWEHGNIPALIKALGSSFPAWPDDRYDVIVVMSSLDGGKTWGQKQVLQAIGLPGEKTTPIK